MSKKNIAFLYPRIAHYREEFFEYFAQHYNCDLYVYENIEVSKKNNFSISSLKTKTLKSLLLFSRLRVFNFIPLLNPKYDAIILIGEMKVLPVWILLILAKLIGVKTILWGHGISIHSYLEEEKKINSIRLLFHKLADHIWLYTENEKHIWENYLKESVLTSVNNTVDIESILQQKCLDKEILQDKYQVKTPINLIYCARFSMQERRTDLLIQIIQNLDPEKYGFIIIGDGPLKPDFSPYGNVFDFGAVYDADKKNELFQLADLYIQPGWIGLSCNEALAYSKPILTFERSNTVRQCVEYAFLNDKNSFIAVNMEEMLHFINNLSEERIQQYQADSKIYAENNLRMEVMIDKAKNSLDHLIKVS
jgi:glycosyltransferase involved in cell wall biosynthesis